MDFDWDPEKHEANIRNRGFGFDFAALIFDGDVIEAASPGRSDDEDRVLAVGEVEGLVLAVVYTDRNGLRRIISARPVSRKERRAWHGR